ncbi:hypothetical protein D3C75_1274320 [compost metagenome]
MIRPLNECYIFVQVVVRSPHLQSGNTHRQIGASVQPALQRNKAFASSMHSGQQQRPFIGLGAAVDEEAAAQLPRQHLFQPLGQVHIRLRKIDR